MEINIIAKIVKYKIVKYPWKTKKLISILSTKTVKKYFEVFEIHISSIQTDQLRKPENILVFTHTLTHYHSSHIHTRQFDKAC